MGADPRQLAGRVGLGAEQALRQLREGREGRVCRPVDHAVGQLGGRLRDEPGPAQRQQPDAPHPRRPNGKADRPAAGPGRAEAGLVDAVAVGALGHRAAAVEEAQVAPFGMEMIRQHHACGAIDLDEIERGKAPPQFGRWFAEPHAHRALMRWPCQSIPAAPIVDTAYPAAGAPCKARLRRRKTGANGFPSAPVCVSRSRRDQAAGRAALAWAITAVNTPASFIARSAIALRSSWMPASLAPWMNCE